MKSKTILTVLALIACLMTFGSASAQNAPKVTTNPRFARGATMAFGRLTALSNGTTIRQRGFCYATHPDPTIDDNTTVKTMSAGEGGGSVFVLSELEPATLYYMRAYATATNGQTGYGDVIKFYTLPKGNVTYWYNNAGDAAANERVNNAATQACQIFNDLTEIVKKFNIGYSSGTSTADCYYADEPWMNMGANSSYQRTGTIMHEMQHGLGLVPYSTQWNKDILRDHLDGDGRGTGYWLGDRVSEFLCFWNNKSDQKLNGDYQHMSPYGVNGAQEDNGSLSLYYANAMIGQALGEDGLEHRSDRFAEPCYIFTHEDDVKYYLKNEDDSRGLYTSYLKPDKNDTLHWVAMAADEVVQNDSAAWYLTFTPQNQYYQLRNAATGQYMTYSGTFKTMARTTLTDNDNFHLMKGRVDVGSGNNTFRGYWLIHPTGNLTPNCITAAANGNTTSQTFDIKNSATMQRWLILTAEQLATFENAAIAQMKQQTASILEPLKLLATVPHTTTPEEASQHYSDALQSIEQRLSSGTTVEALATLADEARQAAFDFLSAATPTDVNKPFDLTFMIENPGMDATDGWTGTPTLNYSCAEYYQATFNFYQIVRNLPKGTYRVMMQGFQRPGTYTNAYNDFAAGTNNVNARLYAGTKSAKIKHIAEDAQTAKLGSGTERLVGGKYYVPDNMQAASKYFEKGLYDNSVINSITTSTLNIRLQSTSMPTSYWCIFDNFRLHFFGTLSAETITAIDDVNLNDNLNGNDNLNNNLNGIYDVYGRKMPAGSNLPKGIYIVNGRKVTVK